MIPTSAQHARKKCAGSFNRSLLSLDHRTTLGQTAMTRQLGHHPTGIHVNTGCSGLMMQDVPRFQNVSQPKAQDVCRPGTQQLTPAGCRWVPLLILGLLIGGCTMDEEGLEAVQTNARGVSLERHSQTTETQQQNPPSFVGVIIPGQRALLSAQLEGPLETLHVTLGQQVSKGDLIAEQAHRGLELQLAQAQAAHQAGFAECERYRLEQVRSAALLKTRQQLKGLISQEDVMTASYDTAVAKARHQAAAAQLEAAAARVAELQAQLDWTYIRAPFDGFITDCFEDPGSMLSKGTPIVRLIASDTPKIRFAVPPDQVSQLEVGQSVSVRVKDAPLLSAEIAAISPEVDLVSQYVIAEATFPQTSVSSLRHLFGRSGTVTTDTLLTTVTYPRDQGAITQ